MNSTHLETPFVFIDTQAYVANAFGWHGIHLGKLATLCSDGTLKLLMTTITRREIIRKIEEALDEAIERTKKYKTVLSNGGLNVELLDDRQTLLANAIDRFLAFLRTAQAIEVPINVSLEAVLDDYFASSPPFAKRKGKEFPDTFAGASLVAWLRRSGNTAYVVSGVGDFEALCERHSCLIYAKSISEVLSRASVAADIHAALAREIDSSQTVKDKLADRLVGRQAKTARQWPRYASGRVGSATVLGIMSVNVIDSAPPSFACELEFEAELAISLMMLDETEPMAPQSYMREIVVARSFVGVVELLYGSEDGLVVQSTVVTGDEVELHMEDL